MDDVDEKWIAWCAGTHGVTPEAARGMLAVYKTLRGPVQRWSWETPRGPRHDMGT
jgi:hypothetical protein